MALKNELKGLRGTRALTQAKQKLARMVGRAAQYDHLPAALAYSLDKHRERERPLSYWEFGTGSGNTLQRALAVLKDYEDSTVVLFDSFKGLPAPTGAHDAHVTWRTGDFAFSVDYIKGIVKKAGFEPSRVRFVEGFFDESLTQMLAQDLRTVPPAFVTLDLDYYSSTQTALTFLQPLLASGCNVFFDDLWSFDGHPELGQLKALNEFNEGNKRGQLVTNTIFSDRIFSYFNWDYEFAKD